MRAPYADYLLRMIDTLRTERLVLRPIMTADAPAFYRFYSDPEVMRYIGKGEVVESEKQVRESLARHRRTHYQEHNFGLWAVTGKSDGVVMGHCGVLFREIDSVREYEIAYLLGREYQGQGYATEAACATRDRGFSKRNFSRMISLIYPDNVVSLRVAERVGMRYQKDVIVMDDVRVRMYCLKNPAPEGQGE